jgi:hypothetical protein
MNKTWRGTAIDQSHGHEEELTTHREASQHLPPSTHTHIPPSSTPITGGFHHSTTNPHSSPPTHNLALLTSIKEPRTMPGKSESRGGVGSSAWPRGVGLTGATIIGVECVGSTPRGSPRLCAP